MSESNSINCCKEARKKRQVKAFGFYDIEITRWLFTLREDCCENVDPSLALTLKAAFYQALVPEFLSIQVLIHVSAQLLLSELSPEPWQEGWELTSLFQHEMFHFHPNSAHLREQAPFLNFNGQEKEEWYELRSDGNEKLFAWKVIYGNSLFGKDLKICSWKTHFRKSVTPSSVEMMAFWLSSEREKIL